jgi:hypothetical protein
VNEQARGGTCHTNSGAMGDDTDHPLAGARRFGAVRDRDYGKPEKPPSATPIVGPARPTLRDRIAIRTSALRRQCPRSPGYVANADSRTTG